MYEAKTVCSSRQANKSSSRFNLEAALKLTVNVSV